MVGKSVKSSRQCRLSSPNDFTSTELISFLFRYMFLIDRSSSITYWVSCWAVIQLVGAPRKLCSTSFSPTLSAFLVRLSSTGAEQFGLRSKTGRTQSAPDVDSLDSNLSTIPSVFFCFTYLSAKLSLIGEGQVSISDCEEYSSLMTYPDELSFG